MSSAVDGRGPVLLSIGLREDLMDGTCTKVIVVRTLEPVRILPFGFRSEQN
jgi:hypothetical protein